PTGAADGPVASVRPESGESPASRDAIEIGRSVEGRPVELLLRGDPDGDGVLLLATIHGDEAAGTPLLRRLADELRAAPEKARGRRVALVPVANPDGLAAGRRTNARGIDLNRNFPAGNFDPSLRHGAAPLSEPESRALLELLRRERPVRVVSLHQPLAQIDWDGPGEALARRVAARCDLPARRIGSRPGSLGSFVGLDLGVPILTFELRRADDRLDPDALWERYGEALLATLD
ncbi:MAG: DUF2817 domain-containing protein, partial [Planctomycetota bacterium JB042]